MPNETPVLHCQNTNRKEKYRSWLGNRRNPTFLETQRIDAPSNDHRPIC